MLKFHKKTLSIVLVSMIAAGTIGTAAALASGDINGDSKIDARDFSAITDYFLGRSSSGVQDINGDGKINILDVCTLKSSVIGESTTGSIKDYGTKMNANATMVEDFTDGSSKYFIASDGWTNGKPFDCWWYEENTSLSNGCLELTVDKERSAADKNADWDPAYSGAEYRTNDFYSYGYYETSMQAIKNDGIVSSFFTYTGPSDDNPWDEIDIEILGKDTTKVQLNYYKDGKGGHEYMYDLGFDASEGYHTYGFDWQPDHITWYVDGKEAYTMYGDMPTTAGKIMMNTWPGRTVDDWLKAYDGKTPLTARYQWVTYNKSANAAVPTPTVKPSSPSTTTPQNPSAVNAYDKTADMIEDFTDGSSKYFIASDGWTNGKPFDCWWYKENTSLKNGVLELTVDKERSAADKNTDWDPGYSGAEYRTNDFYGYGYYETSMKAIKNDGIVSSFFTYTGPSDDNPWDEIDVEILGKDTTKVQLNYYKNGKGGHEYMYDLGFDASEGYHTYGFDWQPDHITWYVDGKEAYTMYGDMPTTAGKIMMNAWPGRTVDDWLKAYDGKTPLTASYQWVTYKKSSTASNNTPVAQPTVKPTQNSGNTGSTSGVLAYNTNATMISNFSANQAGDFFASEGWTNGKPFDCYWYGDNAVIKNGLLELSITGKQNASDGNTSDWQPGYGGGEFRTKGFYSYGYYETSMKAIKNDGVVSSFFTYTGPSDDNPWDEIDIEILGKDTTKVQLNYYKDGQGGHEFMYDLGFDSSQAFHTYGFDWQADHITWYVDGKAVHTMYGDMPKTAGKIMMNAWPGKTVPEWLKDFNGKTPLTAYYQWVTYNKQ